MESSMALSYRYLNGYKVIKLKEHELDTFSHVSVTENWVGWAYEHRYVMEKSIGRKLQKDEVVHHLDCDRSNNKISNLVILVDRSSHIRLHNWIDRGCYVDENYVPKECIADTPRNYPLCKVCGVECTNHGHTYCSVKCSNQDTRKVKDPPTETELIKLLQNNSYLAVGKLYGVSDNAVRKWVRKFGHDPKSIKKLS